MIERPLIMMVGIGDLAGHVLNMLLQFPATSRIILASRNEEYLCRKSNLAAFVASQFECYGEVDYIKIDLWNIEQTAQAIARVKPDIIFNAATLQSWRIITQLPKPVFEELDQAQFGPWLPMHLTLNYKLMQAVKQSGVDVKVINAAFPDAVNHILSKVGLAPTTGIGNVGNIIPTLRSSIAFSLGLSMEQVTIAFVAQHYLTHFLPRAGASGDAPFYLKAIADGEDVTHQLNMQEVFNLVATKFRRVGGVEGQILTASSAAKVILAMASDSGEFMHAPGPSGLPGGYPVRINAQGSTVTLPSDLTLEQAIQINEETQKLDGIERIDENGTVHFTKREMAVMTRMLGYECRTMSLQESEERAKELRAKYTEFASQYGC